MRTAKRKSFRGRGCRKNQQSSKRVLLRMGKNSDYILQDMHYDFPQNEQSPLGRLYELDGYALLLGVDFDKNTSLHLAEYKADYKGKRIVTDGFPVIHDDKKQWHEHEDLLYYPDDFLQIGKDFQAAGKCVIGRIGNAKSFFFSQRDLVDFAVEWMEKNRSLS